MLRIYVFEEPTSVKLRLEGGLNQDGVPLLIARWADVRTRLKGRRAILDLGNVPEMDETGRRALSWIVQSGVQLGYAHPNVCPIVEELLCETTGLSHFTAALWKRFHLATCDKRWDSPYRLCRFICALLPSALRPCGCRTR